MWPVKMIKGKKKRQFLFRQNSSETSGQCHAQEHTQHRHEVRPHPHLPLPPLLPHPQRDTPQRISAAAATGVCLRITCLLSHLTFHLAEECEVRAGVFALAIFSVPAEVGPPSGWKRPFVTLSSPVVLSWALSPTKPFPLPLCPCCFPDNPPE